MTHPAVNAIRTMETTPSATGSRLGLGSTLVIASRDGHRRRSVRWCGSCRQSIRRNESAALWNESVALSCTHLGNRQRSDVAAKYQPPRCRGWPDSSRVA